MLGEGVKTYGLCEVEYGGRSHLVLNGEKAKRDGVSSESW